MCINDPVYLSESVCVCVCSDRIAIQPDGLSRHCQLNSRICCRVVSSKLSLCLNGKLHLQRINEHNAHSLNNIYMNATH